MPDAPDRNKCPYCTDGRFQYTMKNDPYGKHESTCPYCGGTGEETLDQPRVLSEAERSNLRLLGETLEYKNKIADPPCVETVGATLSAALLSDPDWRAWLGKIQNPEADRLFFTFTGHHGFTENRGYGYIRLLEKI